MSKKLFSNRKAILATTTIMATLGIALFASSANAKCYLIYCQALQQPISAPPPPSASYNQTNVQNNNQYYEEEVTFYEDGAKKKKIIKKKVVAKKAAPKKAIAAKKVVTKSPVKIATKKTIVKKTTKTVYASNNYNANTVVDHASQYNAPQKSGFVPLKIYGGRGESWVSGTRSVVRYAQPMHIKNVNGTPCGYSRPVDQPYGQAVMVCKCEQGWQPK